MDASTLLPSVDDIPVAKTPVGGYGERMPPPVLLGCIDDLHDDAIDMRGTWRVESVESVESDGEPLPASPLMNLVQRIEQAANRVVITAGGVVHDMVCDGTLDHGVDDVAAGGGPDIRVAARWVDGVHELHPFGVGDGPPLVTRWLDGDILVWDYAGLRCRCERLREPVAVDVRPVRDGDHESVRRLVAAAFRGESEALLVDDIRACSGSQPLIDLVAVDHDHVVGHVMISRCEIDTRDGARSAAATLSPLAVRPDLHGRGIGGVLVRDALRRAASAGEELVVVEGDPRYYGRFGFRHGAPLGVELPLPDWAPSEAGQVWTPDATDPAVSGTVVYPSPFHGLD
jgi:putative acetyltransferase